jgi:ribosome biogenesis GTPase A
MASSAGKDEASGKYEDDLSSILSAEERVDLTLLIANITELMRKHIADTFDASITNKKQAPPSLEKTDKNPNIDDTKPHEETDEEETARELREKREKELSAPKMLDLKKDALEFFDKWRESVIGRVGSAVNNPTKVMEEQKEKASVEATPNKAPPAEPRVIRK